jgi:hypothetical protein
VVDVAAGFACDDATFFAEILVWLLEPQAATMQQRTNAIAPDIHHRRLGAVIGTDRLARFGRPCQTIPQDCAAALLETG